MPPLSTITSEEADMIMTSTPILKSEKLFCGLSFVIKDKVQNNSIKGFKYFHGLQRKINSSNAVLLVTYYRETSKLNAEDMHFPWSFRKTDY